MFFLQVAFGGALGACLRYVMILGAIRLFGVGFPYGTLIVNVLGSFTMGLLVVVLNAKNLGHFVPFVLVGLLGGFTTFSAFSLDILILWERGLLGLAALYAGASVLLSVFTLYLGGMLARSVVI